MVVPAWLAIVRVAKMGLQERRVRRASAPTRPCAKRASEASLARSEGARGERVRGERPPYERRRACTDAKRASVRQGSAQRVSLRRASTIPVNHLASC